MTLERNDDLRLAEEDTALTDREVEQIDSEDLESEEVQVAEIRADIEETRVEMGGTLQELGDRLDPGNLVNQAKENVREATIGRVEETAKGMSDMVMETIKRNPIPAAMAGAGLALLWMNRSGGSSNGNRRSDYGYEGGAYRPMYGTTSSYEQTSGYGYQGSSGGSGITDKAGQVAGNVGDTVGGAVGQVGGVVGGAVGQVGETVGQVGQNVGTTVGQGVQQAGWRLERFMQSSPLAMGAIALGAGAVVGTLVPETQQEQRVLGEASRAVGETVRETVSQATTKAEEQLDRVEQETTA